MAEFLVGPVIEKLFDFGLKYLEDKARVQKSMKELESLRKNCPKIQAVVDYASSLEQIKEKNPALNIWLWQLRDAIDEADDVMEEFDYRKLREERMKLFEEQRKLPKQMKIVRMEKTKALLIREEVVRKQNHEEQQLELYRAREAGSSRTNDLMGRGKEKETDMQDDVMGNFEHLKLTETEKLRKRLEEVVRNVGKVFSAGVTSFFYLAKEAKQDNQELQVKFYETPETGSLPTNDLIGRGKEKDTVMKWLRNPSINKKTSNDYQSTFYDNISLLSVVGQGGMGKTALVQHVYKDVKTDEFDLKLWVCVSNNFNVKKVIADMLESAKSESFLFTLSTLQNSLESVVNSKKFLLVLDDIWEEEDEYLSKSKWENVLIPLASGKLGSKILVTTRMKSIALMLSEVLNKKNEMLILESLEDYECLLLLSRYAFANVENPNVHLNLRHIAEEIVKKISGSPLAARVIGCVLNSHLGENYWNRVLNYVIGSEMVILNILKLSYISLPRVLRICLSFCCTFPQDYEFDKDDLVRMWISLGFIPRIRVTMKDAGEMHFDFLVNKSLFDKFQTIRGTCYKLHDLLHEMLRVVSDQQCFSIVDDEELQIPETVRYLYIKTSYLNVLRKVEKLKNLHSIHLSYEENSEDFIGVLANIFKILRSIRLMYINVWELKQMPEEIADLVHLRYLRISNDIQICNLRVDILPKNMNNLLQYLSVPFPGIYEIGKLCSLEELDGFYVQNKDGYRIEELKHMNELRVLTIEFRENLKDAEDAVSAKLSRKINLRDLSLRWADDTSDAVPGLNENVLDNLQPFNSLKKLKIINYMGSRPAKWMNSTYLIPKLVYIELKDCLHWQTLPPFWQLPFLKYLYLYNMPEVKGFVYARHVVRFDYIFHGKDKIRFFPSLQVLHIEGLEALENLFVTTEAADEYCYFPCLIELHLLFCPNLQELPDLPPSLKILKILDCHPELMKRYERDTGSDWHKIAHIPEVSIQVVGADHRSK